MRNKSARHLCSRAGAAVALAAVIAWTGATATAQQIVRPQDAGSMSSIQLGRELFGGNCARCHGSNGEGVAASSSGAGPSLKRTGRLGADFYLRTGAMPLANPHDQPERRSPAFNEREIRALEDYIASISDGPPVPQPHPDQGRISDGLALFSEHCAGCHQVVGEGGIVTGARVPPLNRSTPTQIAEAVRIGPYVMPKFSQRDLSDAELNSIIAYVRYAQHPDDRGGWAIDHLGPFPEGMVTWFLAALVLVVTCMIIGERLRS